MEVRNQAAAHTDCILHFKVSVLVNEPCPRRFRQDLASRAVSSEFHTFLIQSATQFIIVADYDDILIPKIARTYSEEFAKLLRTMPHAAGFLYDRYNADFAIST